MYSPLSASANPLKSTRAFAHAAEGHGARILTHHEVTGIAYLPDGRYRVATGRGLFSAGCLVIAAGACCGPMGEMLGLRIPIVPVQGQMWATESLPPRLFQFISSAESALHWSREPGNDLETPPLLTHLGTRRVTRHLYGRQTQYGDVVFGGDRRMVEYHKTPEATGIEVNKRHAAEVVPFLRELPVSRTWAGLMPFSLDGKPIIGRIPQLDNLYIATGLGHSGFGPGPMMGKLLADLIHSGDRPAVLAESDPARCVTPSG